MRRFWKRAAALSVLIGLMVGTASVYGALTDSEKRGLKAALGLDRNTYATVEAALDKVDSITATAAEMNTLDGVTASVTELNYLDVTTLGTVEASKAVTADSSGVTTGLDIAAAGANQGGEPWMVQTDADITSAELLALNATPITLVAAPGAGQALLLDKICCQVDYNSAAYAGIAAGEDFTVKYTDGSGDILTTLETTGWLDQTADTITCGVPDDDFIPVANAALVAHMASGEIITGDSPLDCRVWTSEIPVELP